MNRALKQAAEKVRKQGQRGDKILAHINPAEASYLKKHFGGDKNPKTGLPQYGLKKFFKKFTPAGFMSDSKNRKKVMSIAAPIIGNMILPGAGAVIGGAIGGAASAKKDANGKRNYGKGALRGGLTGALMGYAMPQIGGALGVGQGGTAGRAFGMGSPSFMNNLGLPNMFGGAAAAGAGGGGGGFLSNLFGGGAGAAAEGATGGGGLLGGGGLGNLLSLGALGTMIQGVRKGKSTIPKYEGPTAAETMRQHGLTPPQIVPYTQPRPYTRRDRPPSQIFTPEIIEPDYFEPIPFPGQYAYGGEVDYAGAQNYIHAPTPYADGGYVNDGYFHGASGGQQDNRKTKMKEGSYVMDATTLSLYGDGNSEAGKERSAELMEKFIKAAHDHGYEAPKKVKMLPAMVSDGESIWPPEAVWGAGMLVEGDPSQGVKVLNRFRNKLRKQKGVKSFLPPKSKHPKYYLEAK